MSTKRRIVCCGSKSCGNEVDKWKAGNLHWIKRMKRRGGQILVLILLVVVVALSVGLSVASRNITNLRISTQTEQSQRAFSAAEGGVEDVLSRLSTIAGEVAVGSAKDYEVLVGELKADVTVRAANIYEALVSEGTVAQVDLAGPPAATGTIQIEWAKTSDEAESAEPASIEVTIVYGISLGPYTQKRFALAGQGAGRDEQGFTGSNCSLPGVFKCATTITLESNPLFLRVRPFWNRTTVKVVSVGGSLPVQTYDVTSTVTTELGVTRRVQVKRTALPQLPAAFDYVLFSESDIAK